MSEKMNKGVCCNVCDCVHNENGCDCNLNKITVSKGTENGHHYCKSYACKNERNTCECESSHCRCNSNIEAAHEMGYGNDYNYVNECRNTEKTHSIYNSEFED